MRYLIIFVIFLINLTMIGFVVSGAIVALNKPMQSADILLFVTGLYAITVILKSIGEGLERNSNKEPTM